MCVSLLETCCNVFNNQWLFFSPTNPPRLWWCEDSDRASQWTSDLGVPGRQWPPSRYRVVQRWGQTAGRESKTKQTKQVFNLKPCPLTHTRSLFPPPVTSAGQSYPAAGRRSVPGDTGSEAWGQRPVQLCGHQHGWKQQSVFHSGDSPWVCLSLKSWSEYIWNISTH